MTESGQARSSQATKKDDVVNANKFEGQGRTSLITTAENLGDNCGNNSSNNAWNMATPDRNYVNSKRKSLLPTPDGGRNCCRDVGKGGWRTYNQAKHAEMLEKQFSATGTYKGYSHNATFGQQNPSGPSLGGQAKKNKGILNRPEASSSSGHLYDPFCPTMLMPKPSQEIVDKIYEDMLCSAALENKLPSCEISDPFKYAKETSLGSFVKTDSEFGNCLMPVLPRFENNNPNS